jgi:hypothetical protein
MVNDLATFASPPMPIIGSAIDCESQNVLPVVAIVAMCSAHLMTNSMSSMKPGPFYAIAGEPCRPGDGRIDPVHAHVPLRLSPGEMT